jgi:hypothetical protein
VSNLRALSVTKAGRKVLAQAQIGLPLHFTRVTAGDGALPDEVSPDYVTGLVNPVMNLPINSNTIIGDGTTKLEVVLQNKHLLEMFEFREIGIFATDNDNSAEILYAYSNSGDAPAAYIPAGNGPNAVNLRIGLITVIKQAANIVVDITDGWGYLPYEEWNDFLLNLYGDYVEPPSFLWTADTSKPQTLRGMPFGDLAKLLFTHTSLDGETVILAYNPGMQVVLGYPISRLVMRAEHVFGGDPMMEDTDYQDGELFGGGPLMALEDYTDGYLSGGDPYVY